MKDEYNYNFALEIENKSVVMEGLEYILKPGLYELFHKSKSDLSDIFLDSEKDKTRLQFILTVKVIE